MFMRASFSFLESVSSLTACSKLHDSRVKNKKPFIHSGTKSSLRGTTRITFSSWNVQTFPRSNLLTSLLCYNGLLRHRLLRFTDEVSLARKQASSVLCFGIPVRYLCWASTRALPVSQLADGMTYYSCHNFSNLFAYYSTRATS